MRISRLNLPKRAIDFLHEQGFEELYPPQAKSIKAGLTRGRSVLVSAPTASGKTLIATIAMLSHLSKRSGRVVYLSPLRALASEKYAEFKKLEGVRLRPRRKIKVGISTGDLGGTGRGLADSDILVLTNERMDALLRQAPDWTDDIGLVVSDEVHLIGDETRGPTLEMVLTKVKRMDSRPQIVALSATITNAAKLSEWLGASLVDDKWRPVPLSEGVYDHREVSMYKGKTHEVKSTRRGAAVDLGNESVESGGQSLLFASTRARSVSLATKASEVIPALLDKSDRTRLEKVSSKILDSNEHTKLVTTLANLVKSGVAFHHAGLNQSCRSTIETEFRRGTIKLLSSTPTLAAGVNLPARRVVITSVSRYNVQAGINMPISVLEYKQLCGRAGRPQYDKFGEAIMVGNSNARDLTNRYIRGTPEPIESRMTDEKALRIHVLSLVVTSVRITRDEIIDFFLETLGGMQSSRGTMRRGIDDALEFLTDEEFLVERDGGLVATPFGKRTSMLYIDPETAQDFRDAIARIKPGKKHTLGFLHLISSCGEFFPKLYMRNDDHDKMYDLVGKHRSEMINHMSDDEYNRSLLALHHWIDEKSEVWLSENLKVESGDMHRIVETAVWLLSCLREIAKMKIKGAEGTLRKDSDKRTLKRDTAKQRDNLLEELVVLRSRTSYGIRSELLDLVSVRGIGRVRARRLYRAGIKDRKDLLSVSVKKLAGIDGIGPKLAASIKSQMRR